MDTIDIDAIPFAHEPEMGLIDFIKV